MVFGKIILQTVRLCKSYKMPLGNLEVLKSIDLAVREGEIVAIIGASGVGKSTLLHLLGALDRPTSGDILFEGNVPLSKLSDRQLARFRNRYVGFVFQFHHLLPEFTALENVMMPALIAGSRNGVRQRAQELLAEVGLTDRGQHRPPELSGGEQQRVAVARALMNEPALVLADEPSGNLDRLASESLHELLRNLSRKYRRTFVIVTHNLEFAETADRVVEIFDGQVRRNSKNNE